MTSRTPARSSTSSLRAARARHREATTAAPLPSWSPKQRGASSKKLQTQRCFPRFAAWTPILCTFNADQHFLQGRDFCGILQTDYRAQGATDPGCGSLAHRAYPLDLQGIRLRKVGPEHAAADAGVVARPVAHLRADSAT